MNVAIYARVSSEKQAKDGTIQSQLEALRDYAKAHDLVIAYECLDDGYSGTTLDRPALDQVRDLAQSGSIEGILILSPDRLSRSQANQIILMDEFKKREIKIIFTTQSYNDTPEDNLMLQIQGAVAEYERNKILDRTRRGTKHSVINGQVIGGNVPYGYRHVRKTKTKKAHWVINPMEAEIVRKVYEWYTQEKLTVPKIVKRLEAEGMHSRSNYKKWWTSSIYAILNNQTYLGMAFMYKNKSVEPSKNPKINPYRKYRNSTNVARPKEDWIGIPVPPLIDKQTFENAQRLLKLNSIKSSRNNTKNKYLLRSLVVCGYCGSMAGGHVSNKNTYYACGAKRYKNLTTKPHDEKVSVRHSFLDENIWNGLTELLHNPESLNTKISKRLGKPIQLINKTNGDLEKCNKELEKLEIEEKRIIVAYRENVIELPELKEQKATIAERRNTWETKKKAILSPQESREQPKITLKELGDISARYQRVMAKADFTKRQNLVNLLVDSITLFPNKAVVSGKIPVITGDVLAPARHASPLHNYYRYKLFSSIYSYTSGAK